MYAFVWLAKLLRVQQFATIVAAVVVGLVLVCWCLDRGYDILLFVIQTLLGVQLDIFTLAFTLKSMSILGEAVDEEEAVGSAFAWLCRGERNWQGNPDDNHSQSSTAQSLSTHSEAGCLWRQAATKLFFKVFDPGGCAALRSCFYLLRTGTFSVDVTIDGGTFTTNVRLIGATTCASSLS